ncbi:MAG TPA: ABC transporter permease [Devosia sp.]|jgi:oligopeptide transport system permease protein|nr:ABC transporter permease [Devosia sp.]
MVSYIFRRLLIALVAIFLLATVTFFLMRLVPGDPFAGPRVAPEIRTALRIQYGLDKPLLQQYLLYMWNLLHGDLGLSLASRGHPVTDIIAQAAPVSVDLGLRAMLISITLGLAFGIVAALNRGTLLDYLTVILVLIGISMPSFVVAGLLQYYFGVYWHVLPIARWENFQSTIMPAFALSLGTMATIARYMRASMLEIVHADYIKTAFAKGLLPHQVVIRHQVRNALFPILTILGPAVAQVLTGSFVVETVFAIPGLGRYFVTAMQNLDYTLVMGLTIFFGAFLIAMNFLVDVAYGLIDPRIRTA